MAVQLARFDGDRLMRRVRLIVALAMGGALVLSSPTSAQVFDVPDGFFVDDAVNPAPDRGRRPIAVVRPIDGPFADLSRITLEEAIGPIEDPDQWLRDQLSGDVSGVEGVIDGVLDSPDSPFADPAFDRLRDLLPQLLSGLETMARLPLSSCDDPREAYNAAGALRELYCVFELGPIRQYLVLRVQDVDGVWYVTDIRAMNERRLRHLIAIANSFRVTPVDADR